MFQHVIGPVSLYHRSAISKWRLMPYSSVLRQPHECRQKPSSSYSHYLEGQAQTFRSIRTNAGAEQHAVCGHHRGKDHWSYECTQMTAISQQLPWMKGEWLWTCRLKAPLFRLPRDFRKKHKGCRVRMKRWLEGGKQHGQQHNLIVCCT